ncbi:unnamed protein product [Bursaphelenchus okinawaensis]|uniref:Innexin n=1 Tax=Bursaphelenchus okinawaensis TaxID=465554 RepID=A0A811JS14_9BILA|nr:unnamed protein product [Bursaphelenchus okinawaensis]CAG9080953.1 unnamed protein product [Bursaphelenchus okinawaensis]
MDNSTDNMDRIGGLIKSWAHQQNDDDFVDRLHYKVTTLMLTSLSFMIFAKEYGGNPIRCWASSEWTGSWVEYAHDICFIENTYYVPTGVKLSKFQRTPEKEINYYQWVPFFLLGQAIFYNFPSLFWRNLKSSSGLHVRAILSMTSSATKSLDFDENAKHKLAEFIYNTINYRTHKHNDATFLQKVVCVIDRLQGQSRLAILYYTKKVLFLLTSLYQLVLVGRFLGYSNTFWGFNTINDLRNGAFWDKTGIFPRVTMCDFTIRHPAGHPVSYTVQCVLMANMMNEKIFLGMYCWICILIAITIVNLFQWYNNLSRSSNRVKYVYEALVAGHSIRKVESEPKPEYDEAKTFTQFLTVDGVLIFRLMEINSSCLISNGVLYEVYRIQSKLYEKSLKEEGEKKKKDEEKKQRNEAQKVKEMVDRVLKKRAEEKSKTPQEDTKSS